MNSGCYPRKVAFHFFLSSSYSKKVNKQLQYAERLPIGTEKVIRTVSPEIVKRFYDKWYVLHHMAVVAVGDFSDSQV